MCDKLLKHRQSFWIALYIYLYIYVYIYICQEYRHILRIFNTYCFATVTVVTRTRLNCYITRSLPVFSVCIISFLLCIFPFFWLPVSFLLTYLCVFFTFLSIFFFSFSKQKQWSKKKRKYPRPPLIFYPYLFIWIFSFLFEEWTDVLFRSTIRSYINTTTRLTSCQ